MGQALRDTDGDGIADALEQFHKMAPNAVDTDGDGWSDTEEYARNSNPREPHLMPPTCPQSVRVGAYVHGDDLRFVVGIYSSGTLELDDTFRLSILIDGTLTQIPPEVLGAKTAYSEHPTQVPGQFLAVLEWAIDARPFQTAAVDSLAFLATLSRNGDIVAADAVNLQVYDGVISQQLIVSRPKAKTAGPSPGPVGANLPLGGQGMPDSWVTGSVCSQGLSPAGGAGPVITMEVTSAECADGWDGYCSPPACMGTVGSTIDTIDPGVLIGG